MERTAQAGTLLFALGRRFLCSRLSSSGSEVEKKKDALM